MTPRPRFENLDKEKRKKLLEIAGKEFGAKGFAGASLNQIIARAGISKGAIYYYFDDKADLYETVLGYVIDTFMDFASDFAFEDLEADNFWEVIEAQSRASVARLHKYPWMVRVLRAAMTFSGHAPESRTMRQLLEVGQKWTRRFLERGQALGVVRDDVPMEFLVDFAVHVGMSMDRWTLDHVDSWTDDEEEAWVATMTDLMKRLLEPREER